MDYLCIFATFHPARSSHCQSRLIGPGRLGVARIAGCIDTIHGYRSGHMNKLVVKVGSSVILPASGGITVNSSNPQMIEVTTKNATETVSAIHPGQCSLTLRAKDGTELVVTVEVTAA